MTERIKVTDRYTIEKTPPTEDRVGHLSREGYRSLVNLRTHGEQNEVLSPGEEGKVADAHGLAYLNIPVSPQDINHDTADRFHDEVSRLPGPVAIHCASGRRAGLFTFIHVGRQLDMDGHEAATHAESHGYEFASPGAREFLRSAVDNHERDPEP
ncbi:hypothetical protein C882_0650 [Caenispirillum salinarum AK4]|uniref:Beta-lactamase hydrolase-like protein phosphatase-like domain-containing protein n=1 Tax=Caenispirillum salinarum AK4 TaxID=1238182 RepID=K9GUK2_9PROT|nr:sulfur transferase domain-containing protein [Caenispirillum salinarum]EKV28887.1 hypothetical protein C882_0650 [Caenispirillum salinarum AK4]